MSQTEGRTWLSPDHPLAGAEEKFWRAHEHFESLNEEIRALAAGEVHSATFRDELKPHAKNVFCSVVATVEPPPLRLATIIGDIVHNLRSSLDHLVFELGFLGLGGQVPRRTAYPVCFTRQDWLRPYTQNTLLQGVMPHHRAIIYRTQPCYRRKDAPTNPRTVRRRRRRPLADLENLWNHDKHRVLQPVVLAPVKIEGTVGAAQDCLIAGLPRLNPKFLGSPLEVGTEVFATPIRPTGPEPYVHVQFEMEAQIGFRNGLEVRETLAHIGTAVSVILTRFEREFETPTARKLWHLPRGGWIERDIGIRWRKTIFRGPDHKTTTSW